MATPQPVSWAPIETPPARSVNIGGRITPRAWIDYNYLGGYAIGSYVNYGDLADFVWWTPPGPDDRVYSQLSSTVGSLLTSTTARALEDGLREGYFETSEPDETLPLPFYETLTPELPATTWWRVPVNSTEHLNEYEGETVLGRMSDVYPIALVASAQTLVSQPTMTAQELLQFLFTRWESEFAWFASKPVPDIRFRTPTGDYSGTGPRFGQVEVEAINLPQDDELGGRLTMRSIIDTILSLFPGTALVHDSDGDIAIRVTYGPDAPTVPSLLLGTEDVITISTGRPDVRDIYNIARVTTNGASFQEDQVVATPAYTQAFYFDQSGHVSDPSTRTEVTGSTGVPVGEGEVVAGDTITIQYTLEAWAEQTNNTDFRKLDGALAGRDFTLSGEVTVTRGAAWGAHATVSSYGWPLNSSPRHRAEAKWQWRWDEASNQIFCRIVNAVQADYEAFPHFKAYAFGYRCSWDALGTLFTTGSGAITGVFGYTNGDALNDGQGGDAVEASVAAYGERELAINTDIFPLSEVDAQYVAQGLVLHYINPKVTRDVEQSWWNAFPVKFDHVADLIELPSGEQGYVEERTYTDDFRQPLAPIVASTFTMTLTRQAYDLTTTLLLDSGNVFRLDDGTFLEEG